jgi:hypothetical protein
MGKFLKLSCSLRAADHSLNLILFRLRLAVDNLIAAQIVLADGSIVWASEEDNSDLFFGIRGAGSRLGVATKVS